MESKKTFPVKGKILYYLLIGVLAAIFVVCAVKLVTYWTESVQNGSEYDDLAALKGSIAATEPSQSEPSDPGATTPEDTSPSEPTEPTILPDLLPIYELNTDTVGWITVPDTKINYPVLQSPDRPD